MDFRLCLSSCDVGRAHTPCMFTGELTFVLSAHTYVHVVHKSATCYGTPEEDKRPHSVACGSQSLFFSLLGLRSARVRQIAARFGQAWLLAGCWVQARSPGFLLRLGLVLLGACSSESRWPKRGRPSRIM